MDSFEPIREAAASLHAMLVAKGADPASPLSLVESAVDYLDLELTWLASDNPSLKGARALYDAQAGAILASQAGALQDRMILIAHELGHVVIHDVSSDCSSLDVDATRSTEAAPVGLQRVEDYGVKERRELQANVFGREFLLPRTEARALHLAGESASAISRRLDLPINLVRQQILDAILLPTAEPESEPAEKPSRTVGRDESQIRAAAHRGSPFLLQAGPGTGKTRTLVRRVLSLLEDSVDPAAILVLTFSNRAAGELAERLAEAAPVAAPQIWIGTFHAFGLDLARRYHEQLDLGPDPALFDRSDAIEVLQEILPTLPLVHYRNLWDPEMVLREMLSAISRAKDELVDPAGYEALAQVMLSAAGEDEDSLEAAQKALEVAHVYRLYEEALARHGGVDFGDLIMRPTRLLEQDAKLRSAVRLRHRHVLVDEYQDINRASARLVKAVAGDGERLWVVGDARQSIYRFRGASSTNMVEFDADFPGAVIDRLSINYRSSEEVISTFQAFAPHMIASAGMLPLALEADNGPSGLHPDLRVFQTKEDEVDGIAAAILSLEGDGVRLRDQVVLCRSNARLNEIATGLEARGIPVLHLGSLFERSEIRDLLSLLTLKVDPFGSGLLRIGAMARYAIPLQDLWIAISRLRGATTPAIESLDTFGGDTALSEPARAGFARLAEDLRSLGAANTAWEFLSRYLLDCTDTVARSAEETSISARMRAVAIWQFLNFVRDAGPAGGGSPIHRTLDRVRQLVLLAEERDLRQIPSAALHMNAVRVMTVHGSKGLEFEAVHVPGLTKASFPSTNRGERCPPPVGLVADRLGLGPKEAARRAHEAEEECLFFVALSRAERHLRLYHCVKQDNGSNRSRSPFLDSLGGVVRTVVDPPTLKLPAGAVTSHQVVVTWPQDWRLTDARLESYDKCPRRFFYTHVVSLGGRKKMTAFSKAHDCLYEVIRLVSSTRAGGAIDEAVIRAAFDQIWKDRGPVDHAFAADYRDLAERLLTSLLRSGDARQFRPPEDLVIEFAEGRLLVEPSEIVELPEGKVILRRVRTGYKRSDEYDKLSYGLYHLAGQNQFGVGYQVEALHLTDGDTVDPVTLTDRKLQTRRETARKLLDGITKGEFAPDIDSVTCPRCPHFFICGVTPAGALDLR